MNPPSGARQSLGASGRVAAMGRRQEALLDQADRRGLQHLTDNEIEELGRLHRALSTQLALRREFGASARDRDDLNRIVARGQSTLYGRAPAGAPRVSWWRQMATAPRTVRVSWPYHALAALLLAIGFWYGWATAIDPEWALRLLPDGDDRTPYASRPELLATLREGRGGAEGTAMVSGKKALFASFLWQHNTKVALLAFFSGLLLGLPTVCLVLYNGVVLGLYTRTFHDHDLAHEWWAWILPHGVTEMLAIVLLSGGGLWLGHLMLAPGDVTRAVALRERRGDFFRLVALAFPMLLLAALIESFVRQSGLADGARYVFALATAVTWALLLGLGRHDTRAALLRRQARATLAERVIGLPTDDELAGLPLTRPRAGAPVREP